MSYHERDYMRAGPPSFGDWLRGWTAFRAIFVLNVAVFIFQWVFQLAWLQDALTGEPIRPLGSVSVDELSAGHFWTPFTFMFVHSGWGTFLGNMVLLWFSGRWVQDLYGGKNFLWIYLISGLVGASLEMAVSAYVLHTTAAPLMGASASVVGLLLAYSVAMPEEELPLISITLWTVVRLLLAVNFILAILTLTVHLPEWLPLGNTSYFAQLGGGLAGWYFARSLGYGGVPVHLLRTPPPTGSSLRRRPEMARARRPRSPSVDVDMEAVRRENPQNDPLVSLMKDEIDPILDKINDQGIASLTDDERRTLERASRRLK
ncbi:rhomboid family intramembrane serine protease [Prosthecobacter sp. SYSU 5D2]|uniref:rhomboid family intramembrane serine protease n=1 Tax=Prosthecobacter sp. SYSU 5D2 TaxID=3134134 RepID=UPI0031FF30FC